MLGIAVTIGLMCLGCNAAGWGKRMTDTAPDTTAAASTAATEQENESMDVTVAYPLVINFADDDGNVTKAHLKLTYDDAIDAACEDVAPEGFEVVESRLDLGSDRWESHHRVILRRLKDDSFFAADYRMGLTESQENMFFGHGYSASSAPEGTMVQFDRVWPKQTVTTVYVKSPKDL